MRATIYIIQNDDDLREATAYVSSLMDAETPDDVAILRAQAQLIQAYESKRWPVEAVSVPELLEFLMDQHNMTPADLAPILGTRSRVSEILNGRRRLNMAMIERLRDRFHVSADVFISAGRGVAPVSEPNKRGRPAAAERVAA